VTDNDTQPEASNPTPAPEGVAPAPTPGPKLTAFETEIRPLWQQVWDLCHKHKINLFAGFALDDCMNTSISNTNDPEDRLGGYTVSLAHETSTGCSSRGCTSRLVWPTRSPRFAC